ncbi:MAG: DUF2971 domain-containing protein [Rhizobiales bacterium]|nr:DUF2971 domain-containing protein [Hyphomicrobiales bacterium]
MRPKHWTHDRDVFYKFATRSTTKSVLRNRTLRFSSPRLFNDPFDIQFDLYVEFDYERAEHRILSQLWEAHYAEVPPAPGNELGRLIAVFRDRFPRLNRDEFGKEFGLAVRSGLATINKNVALSQIEFKRQLADAKVLCLSEVNHNLLMWSHYSEHHKGAVLEFRCVEELDSVFGAALPVRYCERMPLLFDEDFIVRMGSGQASINVAEIFAKAVYSKAIDWAYEKEWRLVGGRTGAEKDYEDNSFHQQELLAIYLGCQMPDEDRFEIIDLVTRRFPHSRIFQAVKQPREFSLTFREIVPSLVA